ncbi:MAG TPA: 30S ribosomal protein S8 [Myxococcales bacterium]|nr:30S ribosomal protein S8 [Deltaproteobacteria bacterium]MBU48331.1 30S ribosomal protein S8 [Deltaproteobacteria bacterium]HAA56976.1 30S ribosomal protein S8 [Myxococcales bacterium]|tara:strand:+ start:52592 stop:52990 length:399 start_codon:yes stop_codon:yes gene_type:complete
MAAISDPIADMLTRIRNAIMANHNALSLPSSKMKVQIADILHKEGFISSYETKAGDVQDVLHIVLRYSRGESSIRGLKRVSKPGCRVYTGFRKMPRIRNGLGVAILSTSKGVLSDKEAREKRLGGEVLCYIW